MPTEPATRDERAALLSRRIDESGLTVHEFAKDVLHRDPRTVFRWLAGDRPVPNIVADWLNDPSPMPWPR